MASVVVFLVQTIELGYPTNGASPSGPGKPLCTSHSTCKCQTRPQSAYRHSPAISIPWFPVSMLELLWPLMATPTASVRSYRLSLAALCMQENGTRQLAPNKGFYQNFTVQIADYLLKGPAYLHWLIYACSD